MGCLHFVFGKHQNMDDNFVKLALLKWLPGRRKKGGSGWESMNCLMCHLNGEPSRDTKRKAGVIFSGPVFTYHCFRCGYKAHWKPGMLITKKLETLFIVAGCPKDDIQALDIQSLKLQQESNFSQEDFFTDFKINFDEIELPKKAKSVTEWAVGNPPAKFYEVANYLISRNITAFDSFYWSPDLKNQMSNRVIIPFYFGDKIVGYTARFIKDRIPSNITKYHTKCPNGFLFNNKHIDNRDRKYIILVEGPIDALAVEGVAYMSNTLTPKQVSWLNSSDKDVILVPDKDNSGLEAVEIAIENNWYVSFPEWEDVGDVDDAVNKYGTIWTVGNILNKMTNNKTQIKVQGKLWLR